MGAEANGGGRVLQEADLLACCASRRWARTVAGAGDGDLAALRAVSARALAELGWDDVLEALAAHPRIGDRADGAGREVRWSRGEQSGMDLAADEIRRAMFECNRAYEELFGHVFLICATGRTATEMLGELRARLEHDVETERRVVRAELAKIVDLRLVRLAAEGDR